MWLPLEDDKLRELCAAKEPYRPLAGYSRSAVVARARRLGIDNGRHTGGASKSTINRAKAAGSRPTSSRAERDGVDATANQPPSNGRALAQPPVARTRKRIIKNEVMVVNEPDWSDWPVSEDHDRAIPDAQRRTLMQLTRDTCRWPVGHPLSTDFFFCGATPVDDRPYCAAHCARAFTATTTKLNGWGCR